jgi:Holliday junction DNA helicase RuvA
MIGRLSGILLEKNPPQLLVDCGGVGYEVDVSMSTFYNLPHVGEKVVLFTHQAIREDAHLLFGFGNAEERAVFRQLIKITGVGARTALSILSGMSIADLAQAVTLQESGRLVKVPGIGKKTAERLLLELKGKLGADIGAGGGHAGLLRQGSLAGAEDRAGRQRRLGRHQASPESAVQGLTRLR